MANPYEQTANVVQNITDADAKQYNSLRAEVRALMNGQVIDDDSSLAITYNGFKVNTVTIADAQGDESDITCVITYTWTGFKITQTVAVFDAAEMNITVTTTIGYTGFLPTSVSRVIS
jgi:hypothetical protein